MSHADGGPAFPREDYQVDDAGGQRGMSLRDYFAAKVAGGMVSGGWRPDSFSAFASDCYALADALIKERARKAKP